MGEQKEGRRGEEGRERKQEDGREGEIDYDPVTLQFIGRDAIRQTR